MLNISDIEKKTNLKAGRGKKNITQRGTEIRMTAEFLSGKCKWLDNGMMFLSMEKIPVNIDRILSPTKIISEKKQN